MLVEYLFSTSEGDLPAEHAELALPFKLTPTQNHPHLTLKDYFDSIKAFIFKDRGKPLEDVLRDKVDSPTCTEDIRKIEIRSEKHGALYHLSSVKIFSRGSPVKFSVSTSISEKGRKWLNHEFDLLNLLHHLFKFSYLPEPYFSGEASCHSEASKETLTMMLSEWFEDYHEWHFSTGSGRWKPQPLHMGSTTWKPVRVPGTILLHSETGFADTDPLLRSRNISPDLSLASCSWGLYR